MFTTRRILVALVAATAITGVSITLDQSGQQAVRPAKDQSRLLGALGIPTFDGSSGIGEVAVARDGKAGRVIAAASCDGHNWPYVPASCLTVAAGEASHAAVRMVTVEEAGPTGSTLIRIPVTRMASQ